MGVAWPKGSIEARVGDAADPNSPSMAGSSHSRTPRAGPKQSPTQLGQKKRFDLRKRSRLSSVPPVSHRLAWRAFEKEL
jgi:hypothetical protein